MRYGSLFAGYGGLEMGVASVLGGHPVWFSEIEPAPSKILAHHWPDVPNLGDITTVDWDAVEPVDVLTGGFPCQDVSHAGKRLGLKPGTRSGLWSHMAYAIDKLRPSLVVAENVRGLLSAEAGGDLEPCPWCVGDGAGSPLRALGAVLGDLADLGYDAQWHGVRASDAGAPHGRFRVFVYAWPATDTLRSGRHGGTPEPQRGTIGRTPTARGGEDAPADADLQGRQGREPAGRRHLPTWGAPPDTTRDGRHEGGTEPARLIGRPHAALSGDAPTADASGQRHGRGVHPGNLGPVDADHAAETRQRERAREVPRHRSATTPADARGVGRDQGATVLCGREPQPAGSGQVAWGDYEPAIRRWESVLGRLAPAPTEPGKNGNARLSPAFVEWMMGLPAGHVTAVPGLSRNDQLKALGNGVVPQQATLATRAFLATHTMESAA